MKNRYILLFLAVMLGICFFLFSSFYNEAKQAAIRNTNNEQLLYARQAARGIEDFFSTWTHILSVVAESGHIVNLDKTGREEIELLYRANKNRIQAITRVDREGRIIYTVPFNRDTIGRDISGQEHIRAVMQTRKPVVSNVFATVQGYDAVAVHVPVFRKGAYQGTIGININFRELARRYLEDIKIGDTGYAWMVSRDGTELYCPVPGHTGKSVFVNCKDFPSILLMARDMLQGRQGFTTYNYDRIRGRETVNIKKYAVYMPIAIGNTYWSIVVASSENEIFASLDHFRNKLLAVIAFLLLSGVLFAYFGVKAWFFIGEEQKRRNIEQALRESEERYRLLIDNANEAVIVLQDSLLKFINPMTRELFGRHGTDDLLNRPFFEFLHPDDRAMVVENYRLRNLGEKVPPLYAFRIITDQGAVKWVEINATVIEWQGKPATLNFLTNITERRQIEEDNRRLEERLNRAEKMEALGQLAGGVAHDLNNILGILSGYSELLLLEIPEGQRARSHAEKIFQSTEKGGAIIQDLLTLARRGVTVAEVVNLNSIVDDFLKTPVFENIKAHHPQVTFRVESPDGLLNIKGSPVHLEKTLMNLVANAVESISGKGEVQIRTENRYLDRPVKGYDEIREGDYAVLAVSDTGMGIPAEHREKIFEPFYTKKNMGRSGTGLGLSIVWGTVKDHGGYIDVETKVGEGTVFTLYFPVTREQPAAPQVKLPLEQYMGKGETVLVVDDIAEQRDVASGLLSQLGYRVDAVASGEEAVDYLRKNKADILVLDMIMMPGIDGLTTYQRIREFNPDQKAVLVSGYSETERVREAQQLGAGAYVRKPYVLEKIGLAIRDELQRRKGV